AWCSLISSSSEPLSCRRSTSSAFALLSSRSTSRLLCLQSSRIPPLPTPFPSPPLACLILPRLTVRRQGPLPPHALAPPPQLPPRCRSSTDALPNLVVHPIFTSSVGGHGSARAVGNLVASGRDSLRC